MEDCSPGDVQCDHVVASDVSFIVLAAKYIVL